MEDAPTAAAAAAAAAIYSRVRLADINDVPHIRRLIHELAEFEKLSDACSATDASLSVTLFPPSSPPPFLSFTVLLLELSQDPFSDAGDGVQHPVFAPIVRRIDVDAPIPDPEAETFASSRGGGCVVAGFVLCFPNYSTFLAKPGIYIEDLYVRRVYRRMGLGKMLLSAVAAQTAKMGFGRVEWCVLDWNVNAIRFYEQMGAEVLHDWRICRLTGDKLISYAAADCGGSGSGSNSLG